MLDSNWQVLEQIPIDVGPRHFTVSGTQPALPDTARKGDRWASSNPQNGEVPPLFFLSSSNANPYNCAHVCILDLPGSCAAPCRIKWTLPKAELLKDAEGMATTLSKQGM